MKYSLDWTEDVNQNYIAKIAFDMTGQIIDEIYLTKLDLFEKWAFKKDELSLIYEILVYKTLSSFIDKLLIANKNSKNQEFKYFNCTESKNNTFYENSNLSILNLYYDLGIANNLLNDLSQILNKKYSSKKIAGKSNLQYIEKLYKKSKFPKWFKNLTKFLIRKIDESFFKIIKPKVVTDDKYWSKNLFSKWNLINFNFHYFNDEYKINNKVRSHLKTITKKIFKQNIKFFKIEYEEEVENLISESFSNYFNKFLPISIIEGLDERIKCYNNLLNNSKIEYLFSSTGLYSNDNFKVFALIAKRKKTSIIYKSHGLENYGFGNDGFFHDLFIKHTDFYLSYGDYFQSINQNKRNKIKVINFGSPYFDSFQKWKKKKK